MISDEQTTALQLALDSDDTTHFLSLIEPHSGQELSQVQLFGHHTLLMYALERCCPETVLGLLEKDLTTHELDWSDNNELKSVLRNSDHCKTLLPVVLKMIPEDIRADMIASDWDPEEEPTGKSVSALAMAQKMRDPTCYKFLNETLKSLED